MFENMGIQRVDGVVEGRQNGRWEGLQSPFLTGPIDQLLAKNDAEYRAELESKNIGFVKKIHI